MISMLKTAVKSALIERKIEEYYAGLNERFVSYDAWITDRESKMPITLASLRPDAVKVIEFAECGSAFDEYIRSFSNAADDFVIFVNDRSRMAFNALSVIGDFMRRNPECLLAYGDEDEWNYNCTVRMNPWFKPDFAPDTLLQYFYFGNVIVVRANVLHDVKWAGTDDCMYNLYDMCLQISLPVNCGKVGHIQYVLYHAAGLKRLCMEELYDELKKTYSDKDKQVGKEDKISLVIPSKDHSGVLQNCLESLKNMDNIEIIVVDNGSCDSKKQNYERLKNKFGFNYIYNPMDFNFSKMCNLGAKAATGEYILFLNDDIEAMDDKWLTNMVSHAKKKHVGAVGAKLYYPDSNTIQHAGITNLRLGPVHKMQFLPDARPYYDGRNVLDTNVIAVTGACLMVRKEVFEECGGFCEDLAVAFNDVELCFRLYKMGYYNVQCNSAVLYHHESLSRGNDASIEKQLRLQMERSKMYDLHPDLYGTDPFYHPYLNMDILDTNYSFAYEYPACDEIDVCSPKRLKGGLKPEWDNDCLLISLEYADDFTAWMEHPGKQGKEIYFQGYQFVIGSDNAVFARFLLLQNEKTGDVYEIGCGEVFRPDLDVNVEDGHVSLCGFALVISKDSIPKGRYRVGCMAVSKVGRQRLCRFVNKFIEV